MAGGYNRTLISIYRPVSSSYQFHMLLTLGLTLTLSCGRKETAHEYLNRPQNDHTTECERPSLNLNLESALKVNKCPLNHLLWDIKTYWKLIQTETNTFKHTWLKEICSKSVIVFLYFPSFFFSMWWYLAKFRLQACQFQGIYSIKQGIDEWWVTPGGQQLNCSKKRTKLTYLRFRHLIICLFKGDSGHSSALTFNNINLNVLGLA